jgi:hypothetical protein
MEKHEENTLCEADSKDYSMSLNYKFKKLNEDNLQLQNPQRLMVFKIDQLLLNGLENSGNFDWETKHHLLCQSRQNKR